MSRIDDYFNVFSKSKAFLEIIFQEKSFLITEVNPVNLLTFFLCSVPKVNNGFKG